MLAGVLQRFDLTAFRARAFGGAALPDHPLRDTADVRSMLAQLPAEPEAGLAELTLWASTMNATGSFSPGRRGRVLMALDAPARPLWRELARRYLAPDERSAGRAHGDANILRALSDAASEFAAGFALVLDAAPDGRESDWVRKNRALLALRAMRWLGKRLALAHMLHLDSVGAIWEQVHRLHAAADAGGHARTLLPPFEGDAALSSVRQEYARLLVFELASPDSLRARDVELAFRIAGRAAPAVRLENAPSDETPFAVRPSGDARPGPRAAFAGKKRPLLYIATLPALPRLRGMLERDAHSDPAAADTLFGAEFTVRERVTLLQRLIQCWSADAPRRQARRVALASPARVAGGFEAIARLVPALDKSGRPADAPRALQFSIDGPAAAPARAAAAPQAGSCRVVDASNGGLGLAVAKRDAAWARHGVLVAVMVEPANEWVVGVVRRISCVGETLRLGVQVLARQPRVLRVAPDALTSQAWEDAMKFEATFSERYRKTLLLQPQALPLRAGELLVPPGLARPGLEVDVPLGPASQRIRIVRVVEDGEHFQRVLFEPLG